MTSALYNDVLLEHARHPRHTERLPASTTSARVDNPLCGDLCELELKMVAGRVAQVCVRVRGCAVSVGAGSLAAEAFLGHTIAELTHLSAAWRAVVAGPSTAIASLPDALRPCAALLSVPLRPSRRNCARLAWDALDLALAALPPSALEN